MKRITIEQIYIEEKYNILGALMHNYRKHGVPSGYDEQACIGLLIVKSQIVA